MRPLAINHSYAFKVELYDDKWSKRIVENVIIDTDSSFEDAQRVVIDDVLERHGLGYGDLRSVEGREL